MSSIEYILVYRAKIPLFRVYYTYTFPLNSFYTFKSISQSELSNSRNQNITELYRLYSTCKRPQREIFFFTSRLLHRIIRNVAGDILYKVISMLNISIALPYVTYKDLYKLLS